ncbi:MAG: hypothetical protein U0791_20505 [Gemmataceae bacterium]
MGGQDGNRGYLVQAVMALLDSLDDYAWETVQIEPDQHAQKVDILWIRPNRKSVTQVKSSINQFGKRDAEEWASELKSGAAADDYCLVLVGPCSQSVVEMGTFLGVAIRHKNLDIDGIFREAAHALDKFLEHEGLQKTTATQRELMIKALTTHLSTLSTRGRMFSRNELIALLKQWITAIAEPGGSAWEGVSFDYQRGIENAVAGKRLGPSDTDACPEFAACDEIVAELNRSHFYQVVGTPGCGKSITAWHVARRLEKAGIASWRPRAGARVDDLVASLPRSQRTLLVVDDAQVYGRSFVERMSEVSGPKLKVLLISTVQEVSHSSVICISPKRGVETLTAVLSRQREQLLPIIRQYDTRVGTHYFDQSFEDRLRQAGRENTPWEFFWVLRGGWQTARREFEGVKQFAHAVDVLFLVAIGQIASCDAGVTTDWVRERARGAGIGPKEADAALGNLCKLNIVQQQDFVRTRHISYAYRIVEESLQQSTRESRSRMARPIVDSLLGDGWSLRGVAWTLDAINPPTTGRWMTREAFGALTDPLTLRCVQESDDLDWAAGCLSRLFNVFEAPTEAILEHGDLVRGWAVTRAGLVSLFCSNVVNELINRSDKTTGEPARAFIERIDGSRLADVVNSIGIDECYAVGQLLDRLAFFRPNWAPRFFERFDWPRIRDIILAASPDRASAVDVFVTGVTLLSRGPLDRCSLNYIEEVIPYLSHAIQSRPCESINEMHGVFWTCLGYVPTFLSGGREPDSDQVRVAKQILSHLEPRPFALAMETATPRDLEGLARGYEVIHKIDRDFIGSIANCLSEVSFFAAAHDAWVNQSGELDHLIRYFCIGPTYEPAASWVRKNQHLIDGPFSVLYAWIAPDIAIEWHKSGRQIDLIGKHSRLREISYAIMGLAKLDNSLTIEIVEMQIDRILEALYKLTFDEPQHLVRLFRTLHSLSSKLFARFVDRVDLEHPIALKTSTELPTLPKNERRAYQRIARLGEQIGGRLAKISAVFLRRLKESDRSSVAAAQTTHASSDAP